MPPVRAALAGQRIVTRPPVEACAIAPGRMPEMME
jgi:hypothetical protein